MQPPVAAEYAFNMGYYAVLQVNYTTINWFKVITISCRHTVRIFFAQGNGVEDPIKDFSVPASKVRGRLQRTSAKISDF